MAGPEPEGIAWVQLTRELARDIPVGSRVVAVRGDDKMYAGRALDSDLNTLTLASGNQRQVLQFENYRYMFAVVKGPAPWTPRMAERKLIK